ncbi:MAG: RNA polymerase sigma factor [Peptoniphilaceae bacterium]
MIEESLSLEELNYKYMDFEKVYNEFFIRVFKFISYRVNINADVEDVTAEVFQKIYKNLNKFDPEKGKLEVWIFKMARNTLNDYYRSKRRISFISIDKFVNFFSSENYVHDKIEKEEEYSNLNKIVKKLPERERQILGLKFGAELSNKDIGEILEISPSNVGVILHRVTKKIKKDMEAYYEG